MVQIISDKALDILFRSARSYNGWQKKDVSDVLLRSIYELAKLGPTTANSCPSRFVFVKSQFEREKLAKCVDAGNAKKVETAPCVAIIAMDTRFYEHLNFLFPHAPDAHSWFAGKPNLPETMLRNSSLQGAYLMLAARSLGLDCGPMSGFDAAAVKGQFLSKHDHFEVNFICAIGYGDDKSIFKRHPRFAFDEVCNIV